MAFYYVSRDGTIRLGKVHGPATIKLATGEVLPDPPPDGEMFATEEAAQKFSELVKQTDGDLSLARAFHREWLNTKDKE
jgi:hypothetical protein